MKFIIFMVNSTVSQKKVFFISDGTGITAESLGQSLLTQFENFEFDITTIPFINTEAKAKTVIESIHNCGDTKPIVFSTLVDTQIRKLFQQAQFLCLDLFHTFISPLEQELQVESNHSIGKTHGVNIENYNNYMLRMNAVNFVLNNDDGANIHDYQNADVILIGVSRCGKTPTCLYLAMQFGIYAANYPITEDEEAMHLLPEHLAPYRSRLFGLTIEPRYLAQIRAERRPNSRYCSLQQCQFEIRQVENLFRQTKIPFLETTTRSIEEIATEIMSSCQLKRKIR